MAETLRRLLTRPASFCAITLSVLLLGLGLDHFANEPQQVLLGLCTWAILLTACWPLAAEDRARTAVVVMVATTAEVIGSIIWGVYHYRLGNLPLFVPPGHGLVYLTGLRISQSGLARARPRAFVGVMLAVLLGWAAVGLSGVLGRTDLAGAVGAATLAVFILRGRAPALYAGVFLAVAVLEIYGTAIGTWRWAAEVPGLGIADGNPPSGAASGYVLFDICALAFGASLLGLVRRLGRRPVSAPAGEAAVP